MAGLTPRRLRADDPALSAVLALIRRNFIFMDGRVNPPSSMYLLTPQTMTRTVTEAEIWVLGDPPVACVFLTPKPDHLYLGKLCVDEPLRRQGLGRLLMRHAEARAAALGLPAIELETRIELIENQRAFVAMGFRKVAETAHPGYDRATSLMFRKEIA